MKPSVSIIFYLLFVASGIEAQITERICGGIQYEVSLNNWGENAPAASAVVFANSIDVDNEGNIIVAHRNSNDPFGNRIRKIDRVTGIITSLAGCNVNCTSAIGGPALEFSSIDPWCISVDYNNDVYFLDVANVFNRRVYKINALTSNIELVPGSIGIQTDFISVLNGEIYYSNFNHQIYKINLSGIHQLIAGTGNASFSGDNSQAPYATLNNPKQIKVLPNGTVIFIDFGNKRIRKVENGIISTIVGNGITGPSCNNCNPINSSLQSPLSLDIDNFGNIYFVDYAFIKKINKCDGIMNNIAGNGLIGTTNANIPPLQTSIYNAGYGGLCVDNLQYINFITNLNQIYRIKPQVAIDEVAGSDQYICFGDSLNLGYNSPNLSVNWSNGVVNNSNIFVDSSFSTILTVSNTNGCVLFNDEVNIFSVPKPQINQVFDDYTCGMGYVKISANTNSVNSTIRWYSDSILGNSLHTGEQFTTPILTADSSFYAEAYDTIYQCASSNRELVNAFINPPNSCTYIPDNVFESKLIQQNIDDQLNDYVKTSKIDTLQLLAIGSVANPNKVYDLTGIEDFVHLKKFYAQSNHISNLDLTNNVQLTTIDVQNNYIEFFNASMLPSLCTLRIHNNLLTCLNINNNNNQALTELITYNNPNLTCIKVDNHNWVVQMMQQNPATHFWWVNGLNYNDGSQITQQFCGTNCDNVYQVYGCTDDNAVNYNYLANYDDGSCQYLGVVEQTYFNTQLFPNPSENKIQIKSKSYPYEYTIYSMNGIVVKKGSVNSENDEIDILNLTSGFYIIENIELNEKMSFTKFN